MHSLIHKISENLDIEVAPGQQKSLYESGDAGTESAVAMSRIHVKKDAYFEYVFALKGATQIKKDIEIILDEGAELNFVGIFDGAQEEKHQIKATVYHLGPHSRSNLLVKGVLRDSARNGFKGLVKMEKEAQQSVANLEQRVLLLSKGARAEGQPEFEILANDVKAAHAAAIGRINQEQMFYMTSRGIEPEQAKAMIVGGFLGSIITNINDESIKEKISLTFNKEFNAIS